MNNYIVVGAGGTGTHLLPMLHRYLRAHHATDEWMLHIVDGDEVEAHNLERQLFDPGMVTMNKAEAAAMSLGDEEHVVPHPEYVSEENMNRYVQSGDVVLICADNMTVRKRIEDAARATETIAIINGGNEKYDGSVQLYVRAKNEDVTPRLSYLHPELDIQKGADRAEMTCAQAATLPGGEQTIIANATSANWMLTALWRYHNNGHVLSKKQEPSPLTWTEVQFDALHGTVEHMDQRMSSHWRT